VISDDLDMSGAGVAGSVEDRWRACESAGCDLALVCDPASAEHLVAAADVEHDQFEGARASASRLLGRAQFTLAEQELVSEFRAWKQSLNKLAAEYG